MEGGLEGEGKKLHGRKGGLPGSGGVADGPDSEVGDEEGAGAGVKAGGKERGGLEEGEEGEEGDEGEEFHFGKG